MLGRDLRPGVPELATDVPDRDSRHEELRGLCVAQVLDAPVPKARALADTPPLPLAEVRGVGALQNERVRRRVEAHLVEIRERSEEPPREGHVPHAPALGLRGVPAAGPVARFVEMEGATGPGDEAPADPQHLAVA